MGYRRRLLDPALDELIGQLPAVSIIGPRASGKTTTARRRAATVVRLDRDAEAAAFRADPDVALRGFPEPILLDEWQEVPEVLSAVKRAVDDDPRPSRFLLTGSVRADLDAQTWPGTGRLVRTSMHGLTEREIGENVDGSSFLERVLAADASTLGSPDDVDLSGYLDRALVGGFPEPALRLQGRARESWLDSYVDQIITRDAPLAGGERDPDRLRRFLEVVVLNTAGVVADNTLYEAATITARTASIYEQLMRNIFVLDTVPAWTNTRLPRLAKVPKRYVVDPSIVTALLRVDRAGLLRDGDLMGRVIETFVAAQIRPELTVSERRPRWFHLRDKGGRHEIDLVIEFGGGAVVGIEVKAGSTARTDDARHLAWLRDNLQDRFIAGIVLHTGPRAFTLSDRIIAAPISTIWAG